ncbi:hypothetical protein BOW53_05275 [Solemya pervernicosa gill symbiont]|uniref:DUF2938 domain-containing protein n=2 Tax=Gammaproteobacteria incertae sedis TaxID=118884 RepID=A0A1T2L7Q7_9GAMM|nr:DUF2938 family protein [Candidatus Reidiella endopervernicosa]OOZ41139.1 hypothetical protein BOW53_05275 [Solemya pervernicosa gill symbiont]
MIHVIIAITIGLLATALLDVFSILMAKYFGTPKTEWRFIGRWFLLMRKGQFTHGHISKSEQVQGELAFGWFMHYLIGVSWSLIYFFLTYVVRDASPTLLSASLFGVVTLVVPYLILQPALGHGFFAQKHPRPVAMPILSFLSHLTFGQAMYLFYLLSGLLALKG